MLEDLCRLNCGAQAGRTASRHSDHIVRSWKALGTWNLMWSWRAVLLRNNQALGSKSNRGRSQRRLGPNPRASCSGPSLNLEVLHASVRKLRLNPRERREKLPWKLSGSFRNQTIHVLASSKHG